MRGLPAVLVVLCSVFIAVPVAVLWPNGERRGDVPPAAPDPGPPRDPRVAELLARLQQLEARVDALAAAPADLRTPVDAGAAPVGPELAALDKRLAVLELAAMRPARTPAAPPHLPRLFPGAVPAELDQASRAALVKPAEQTILDPAASVETKLAAHEGLRRVPDAYTPPMMQELLRIAATSPQAQLRADVWRFFDGASKLPELVPPLLQVLANDTEAIVREEAAETLGNYQNDPVVQAALRWAADHDTNERVRAKAQRTLQNGSPR